MRLFPLTMLVLLANLSAGFAPARAAQTYDSCTGYIDALPASISTQGTWCLRGHKFTSQTSGAAISVLTDNVTIDCNHFRVSGFGAGAATNAIGITAGASRLNATIRRCRIQGFKYGVVMYGANHLLESNRFDGNSYMGIYSAGEHHVIRGNEVTDTGGRPGESQAFGILGSGSGVRISGNTVHGVAPAGNALGERYPRGIYATGVIEDNHVGGLDKGSNGHAWGIFALGRSVVRRNMLVQATATVGAGIQGSGAFSVCRDNDIVYFQNGIVTESCELAGNNLFIPGVF